ncbi:hypothetical protein [uncultured Proteiniphilum sp.]|uniref:hypothetical protein n=1 Tax=uncultured Proteiniphilum sp. TaxID=497637 RepID=UPI0026296CD7|nr:hypothetical protein [uncultured Proteiniphilum sp.]
MKKTVWVLFLMTMCSGLLFSASIDNANEVKDDVQDRIALGRLGGTTRGANAMSSTFSVQSVEPVVEAYNSQNVISISVQNYRGGAWVEIIGPREAKQSYFEVYDMGFEVVNLSGLRAGEYTIRITLGSEVYTGTFKKVLYGR